MKKNIFLLTKQGEEHIALHTKTQLKKVPKKYLIDIILGLEKILFNIYKSELPRLKTIKQKALPKHKLKKYEMPIAGLPKRSFTRKQLAAQRLFAKRARAGTLRRR